MERSETLSNSGKVICTKQVWAPEKRISRKLEEKERQKIAKNRKLGACPEHKKSKKAACRAATFECFLKVLMANLCSVIQVGRRTSDVLRVR